MSLKQLLKKKTQFILFGGKGGVGKTTCASSCAVKLAKDKKLKILIFSTDPAHSLGDSLEQELSNEPQLVSDFRNFFALEIDAKKTWEDFKKEYGDDIREILNEGTYLEAQEVSELFDLSLPGLDEVMGLKRIMDFMEEEKYDRYILDTAPTGHTLRLLALPDLLDNWIKYLAKLRWKYRYMVSRFSKKSGEDAIDKFLMNMKKTVKHVNELLTDSEKTEFVAITIPEALSVYETKRMIKDLDVMNIPVRHIVINNIVPKERGSAWLEARRKTQENYIKELKKDFGNYEFTEIEQEPEEIKGLKKLEILANKLF